MKAELRTLHSPDVDDLVKGPPDHLDFCVLVQALVGPAGDKGEESFDIMVCTPAWLSGQLEESRELWGRHYLFVAKYDFTQIEAAIKAQVDACEGETWDELALKMARFGRWEFEDYET